MYWATFWAIFSQTHLVTLLFSSFLSSHFNDFFLQQIYGCCSSRKYLQTKIGRKSPGTWDVSGPSAGTTSLLKGSPERGGDRWQPDCAFSTVLEKNMTRWLSKICFRLHPYVCMTWLARRRLIRFIWTLCRNILTLHSEACSNLRSAQVQWGQQCNVAKLFFK
jgi:hypothetical protein